ncbi:MULTISPECIES: hypothetical protein [Photorhabdus]|uniref:hypothetical protein n=1 Tax=Photorhabdus TaxID=29487 RepID=UPI000DCD48E1|nr:MULTISPECIES: hypothetical protein [Photorhabdus]MCT8343281.1 hypothetical protein [Photorhabdus kleinii]RAW98029.1 hypothetical protein CKY05_12720 [Photorhabdus sp. S10-54]RAW98137.1 hypothetical protein CKY03_12245 [Photorhabdus sp. S9-53]RAX02349.1 hypothetical protein CKY04_12805 [Photorhabdus sp. S8-52]
MSTDFEWDPKNSQVYTKDYGTGSITLSSTQSDSFDKLGGANFTMNAESETLTLQNDSDNIPIYWPEFTRNDDGTMTDSRKGLDINVSAGTLEVVYLSENRNNTVAYLGCAESAKFNLEKSGILSIKNPGTVFMFIDYVVSDKPPKLIMSGNSQFEIRQKEKIEDDVPAFIFLASEISLSESSKLTFESSNLYLGDGNFNYCNISIQDKSTVTLINNGIMQKNDIEKDKTWFKLTAGSPSLKLKSFDGIHFPLYFNNIPDNIPDNRGYPEGLFNFINTEGKNEGKITINFEKPGPKEDPYFFTKKIFEKKLIHLNGQVADKESFNISYGNEITNGHEIGTVTISLKN